jgi:hypothetical protein
MTRNYFTVKTINSQSLAGASPTEGFCVEPSMKGPSFVYFFLILTNCNQMSQFNSIFSPLSNKLARLAGITLLAVAALFASTQQISAQTTCVQNLVVNLNGSCEATVALNSVVIGSTSNLRLKINDNNPTDDGATDGQVNAVSPATGWSYGVFNTTNGQLVCQGTIIVQDRFRPVFTDSTAKHWKLIDTIVTWADNLDNIVNQAATYGALPTAKSDANRFYTGRPWLIDSCELNAFGPDTTTFAGTTNATRRTWLGIRLNAQINNPDTVGGRNDSIGRWPITIANMQLKVTDYLESPQCDSIAFQYKLRRSFQFIDRRGNDTTLNQIIYFQRPANRGSEASIYSRAASSRDGDVLTDTIHRGPGNLGQFGPFGASLKRTNITYNGSTTYVDRMTIAGAPTTAPYTKARYNGATFNGVDTFQFNIQGSAACVVPPSTEAGHRALLQSIYVAKDSTPIGAQDSVSLFDDVVRTRFNYSVSFETTTFDACNGGKKFQYITSVFDWCGGGIEKDTIIVKFEDLIAPIAAAKSATAGTGNFVGKIRGRRTVGTWATDSVIISVGTNDCTASLRLPNYEGVRSGDWERDLGQYFNYTLSDICSNNSLRLNYKFETRDEYNNGYFIKRSTTNNNSEGWVSKNYTVANMNNSITALGFSVGEHRLIIEAWDVCNNNLFDTLYFDVNDQVAPVMKCDNSLNVTLTSNSTSNYFLNNFTNPNASQQSSTQDQYARVYVSDINEGSRDNCTIDSMFVRRVVSASCITNYMSWNMDYDAHGNSDGVVTTADFTLISTGANAGLYYTPMHMQYVEFFCCDGQSAYNGGLTTSPMIELWGSDVRQPILGPTGNNINTANPNPSPNNNRNWSYCWTTINLEDKTPPTLTAPNLSATYNNNDKNWASCTDKETIGNDPKNEGGDFKVVNPADLTWDPAVGKIGNPMLSNAVFGIPDIYGIECNGTVEYKIKKNLTCDTGVILRIWQVSKTIKTGTTIVLRDTQIVWVQANHDYTINVPGDVSSTCADNNTGEITFDEAGCDLLAISGVTTKEYDASAGDNFCKKVYKTWTVINWCQVPNQFVCANADPMTYARVIPRLQATSTPANNNAGGEAKAASHRFVKSSSSIGTNRVGGTSPEGVWLLPSYNVAKSFPSSAVTGATTVSQAVPANGTKAAYALTNYAVLNPALGCSSVGENTFAWQYTQVIKVTDVVKPTVATTFTPATAAADVTAGINWNATKGSFSISGSTCVANVKLTFTAKDECTKGDLELEAVKLFTAGTDAEVAYTSSVSAFPYGPTSVDTDGTATFTVSLTGVVRGSYDMQVTVRDDCGNVTVSRIPVLVQDNKAPAPVCVQNLTATLMPDGIGGCMVVVNALDVFQDTDRNWNTGECTPTVKATIVKLVNGVEVGNKLTAETLTLTDADKGGVTARVYLTDGAGNADFCTVTINVEDNFCGNGTASAAVAGAIQTESKATVEGVQVNLSGQTQKSFSTSVNGLFVFNNLTAGADYTVTPSLNKGFLNGVSTFDLVLISKHILGVQPLNTPYKLIAADVNNSKSVTTLDLIQLRKLILNIDATFANNSSWRFVDASYTFPNASNPWAASFPEVKNVNDLEGSLSANFVAVKVGDVNGNAIANSTQGSVRNLTSNLGINVADMNMVAGNEYKVDFTAADLNGIEGFQFTLNLDKKGLELVDLVPGIAAEENFGIFAEEGVVTASWNGEAKGGVLFSLVVRAKSNTTLSEVLNLNSRYTAAEAYKGGEVVNVGLNFNASKASANYELYQNTPNPFAGESIIGFNLPAAGSATLTIQDVTGRTLKVINGQYAKGYNQVSLKSTELSATGVLTYTLKAADFTATRKMIIVE